MPLISFLLIIDVRNINQLSYQGYQQRFNVIIIDKSECI